MEIFMFMYVGVKWSPAQNEMMTCIFGDQWKFCPQKDANLRPFARRTSA